MAQSLREFLITLFVVIDPIGSVPVPFFSQQQMSRNGPAQKLCPAGVLVAGLVLLGFLVGRAISAGGTLDLGLGSFQVAGGLSFLFALSMISETRNPRRKSKPPLSGINLAGAVFRWPLPSIASPGAMLADRHSDGHHTNRYPTAGDAGLLLVVLLSPLCIAVLAGRIGHLMGRQGQRDQPRHGIILLFFFLWRPSLSMLRLAAGCAGHPKHRPVEECPS